MRLRTALAALTLAALVFAGCGGSHKAARTAGGSDRANAVLKQIKGLSAKERERKLVTLAKQEGDTLTLYSSTNADTTDAIIRAFKDAYDIDVALYSASGDTILARILEEEKAGFHGSDVVQVNALAAVNLHQEGLLAPYAPLDPQKLVPGARFGDWTAFLLEPLVLGWNTKLVSREEVPRSWADLADPRWKGKLGIEAADVDVYKTLHDVWRDEGRTEQEIDRLFAGIGDNAVVVHGHSLLAQLHGAGEFALAINYAHRLDESADDGAPLAWQPAVEPVIVEPQGMGVMRNSRRPAAAILFADWMLGPGQKIVLGHHRYPVSRADAVDVDAKQVVVDFVDLAKGQQRWTKAFETMLARGRPGPSD